MAQTALEVQQTDRFVGRLSLRPVHIGARVRDLVIGSGLEFEERGAHELKSVPGEWRLFAVASTSDR